MVSIRERHSHFFTYRPRLEQLEDRVVPADFMVNSLGDSDMMGSGTLRRAIIDLNLMGGANNTIYFQGVARSGTINLGSAFEDIDKNVVIEGPGGPDLTVRRSAAMGTPQFRILTINTGKTVTIKDLTISHGMSTADGGGILNAGVLMLERVSLLHNQGRNGGGIFNADTVFMRNSEIRGNIATGTGGGIHNSNNGVLNDLNTFVVGNRATYGGGIYNAGGLTDLTLTKIVDSNIASFDGGGIWTSGRTVLQFVSVNVNRANANGGGILNLFELEISNSQISVNSAGRDGGGIFNTFNGVALIQGSSIGANTSVRNGGGIWNDSPVVDAVSIKRSTVRNNTTDPTGTGLGGGLYNRGKALVEISTFSGNEATAGAGIYAVAQSTTEVRMSTFAMNKAQVFGGGVFVEQNASLTIFLTIVAGNTTGFVSPDVIGTVTSHGFNFIGNGAGSSGWRVWPIDRVGTPEAPLNPVLSALDFWGGSTETHILLPGSPARDTGDNSLVTSGTDQRDYQRIVGIVDIGAVEMQDWEEDIGDQWASALLAFSSQYSPTDWSAAQALGAPNTFAYGDMVTAWAPSSMNGTLEHITVGFATPAYATGVTIRETWGNGFVYQVDLLDVNNVLHTIWSGVDPSQPGTPVRFCHHFPGHYLSGLHFLRKPMLPNLTSAETSALDVVS